MLYLQFSGVLVQCAAMVTFRHGVLTRATGRAIENYHQERGSYPTELGALTPEYLPIIFGPLTGRGRCGATRPASRRSLDVRSRARAVKGTHGFVTIAKTKFVKVQSDWI